MQFKGKLKNQTWENGKKKLISGSILALLAQMLVHKICFVSFTSAYS